MISGINLEQWLDRLLLSAADWLPRLALALLLLLLIRLAAGWTARTVHHLLEPSDLGPSLSAFLVRVARITVFVLGLVALLFVLNLDDLAFSFIAGLGITGILLAFALQEIAKNLAAGLLLLFQRPFNIGDRIRLGDHEGVVQDIGLRATYLRTDDNREVILPNAGVYTGIITNLTRYPARRFSQTFKLAAAAPLDEVLPTLETATRAIQHVREMPPPQAIIADAGTPTVEVRYWLPTKSIDHASINSQIAQYLRTLIAERGWS